jgi:hypothetical protein
MQNGMAMDFSWLSSAERYLKLYEETLAEKAAGSRQLATGSRQIKDDTKQNTEGGRQTTEDKGQQAEDERQ